MKRLFPLAALLLFAAAAAAEDVNWLQRASTAVRTTDYRGTLVYLRDGKMDTLRIVHRYRNGRERERLVSLTGAPREIIRDGGVVTCVLPADRVVLVAHHARRNLLANVANIAERVDDNYEVRDLGARRLADRKCRAILIEPKDKFRYGYRLLIDERTHLPLKLDLLYQGEVLEQLMFTEVEFPAHIPDSALEPTFDLDGFRWVRHQPITDVKNALTAAWQAGKLPPGFRLAETGVRRVGEDTLARQLLFTDGIATVSAFIAASGGRRAFTGATTMGAVNAYGRKVDGHQITVVGEVPSVTVRLIAEHIQRSETAAAETR